MYKLNPKSVAVRVPSHVSGMHCVFAQNHESERDALIYLSHSYGFAQKYNAPSGKKGKVSERTLRKDTESFRKEFGKNSDSDCFRILCELCFRFLSECPMNEVFPTVSDFFPNVPPPNSFRTFPNFFRSVPLRRFRFLSKYIGGFNPF